MVNDSTVKHKVEHELAWDPALDASAVQVAVNEGVVTLTGSVRVYREKVQAERAAKRIRGVRGLANDLAVQLGSDARSDTEIAHEALTALRMALPVSSDALRVIVDGGHLRLEGQVKWHFLRYRAETLVHHLRGVRSVENDITVAPSAHDADVHGAIQAAFWRNAQIEAERISVHAVGGSVVLRGTVKTWAERDEAERAAWMAPGVTSVRNDIAVGP